MSKIAYKAKGVWKVNLGLELRRMRKGVGKSQEDIALKLHMSISNISRLENNKYQLKAEDLIKWIRMTESELLAASFILGINTDILQQALETVDTNNKLAELMDV